MTTPPLTPAQRAALDWWTSDAAAFMSASVEERKDAITGLLSLGLLVEMLHPDEKGGGYWITPAGEALRKELKDA